MTKIALALLIVLITSTSAAQARPHPSPYVFVGDRYALKPDTAKIPRPDWRRSVKKKSLHAARKTQYHRRVDALPRKAGYYRPKAVARPIPPAPLDAPPINPWLYDLNVFFASLFAVRVEITPVEPAPVVLTETALPPVNVLRNFLEWLARPLSSCHGWDTVHPRVRRVVEDAARHFRGIAVLSSCYRSAAHNAAIYKRMGRRPTKSWHIRNAAADFYIPGVPRDTLYAYVRRHKSAGGVGRYARNKIVHADAGPTRSWCEGCGGSRKRVAKRSSARQRVAEVRR